MATTVAAHLLGGTLQTTARLVPLALELGVSAASWTFNGVHWLVWGRHAEEARVKAADDRLRAIVAEENAKLRAEIERDLLRLPPPGDGPGDDRGQP